MAVTYDAGLRIRPPEPMPDCADGESPQDYFARVLSQCALESATSAENTSGDSSPTPFNIGQIQHDLAAAEADIDLLQASTTTLQADVSELRQTTSELSNDNISGIAQYLTGETSVDVPLTSPATRRIFVTPINKTMAGVYVSVGDSDFTIHFTAAPSDGFFHWFATQE